MGTEESTTAQSESKRAVPGLTDQRSTAHSLARIQVTKVHRSDAFPFDTLSCSIKVKFGSPVIEWQVRGFLG